MTNAERLLMLKANLEISNNLRNDYLMKLLEVAQHEIIREGITLINSIDDDNLIVMYAAYLYRNRVDNVGMPRMLRYALNNRLLSEKMGSDLL